LTARRASRDLVLQKALR